MSEVTVGQRIADLRRRRARERGSKLSQKELAKEVGVSRQTVVYWETDVQEPKGQNLTKLAEVLGVGADEIIPTRKTVMEVKEGGQTYSESTAERETAAPIEPSDLAAMDFVARFIASITDDDPYQEESRRLDALEGFRHALSTRGTLPPWFYEMKELLLAGAFDSKMFAAPNELTKSQLDRYTAERSDIADRVAQIRMGVDPLLPRGEQRRIRKTARANRA